MAYNPFSKIITSRLKKTFSQAMDALLGDEGTTVPCRLVYGGTSFTICPNCIINNVTKKSSGTYKDGGPTPFTQGLCPVCYGEGKKENTSTEDIYLMVVWNYKKWLPMAAKIATPEGYIQTVSKEESLPKLKRAKEIIVNTKVEDYVRHRFVREGEPQPCGCCLGEETVILTLWKRAG